MAMLEQILQQAKPGVNPELEAMISKLMMGSGATPGEAQGGVAGAMRQPLPQSALGTGVQPQGAAPGSPLPGAAPGAMPGGQGQQMPPEQANRTYQVLVSQGVPPQLAKEAIGNPALLRDILRQLQGGQDQEQGQGQPPIGPQEQPQMVQGNNNRMTPPGFGGGPMR
jgi:hypothetical protein